MKKFILIVAVQLLAFCVVAQKYSRNYSGTVKYQKTEQPATIFEFKYPASEIEDGLIAFFKEQGIKPKENKGFYFVSNAKIATESKPHDIYYKVEKDGKDASKVYAILTEVGEDPLTRTSSHTALAVGAGAGLVAAVGPAMDDHDYKVQLTKQEEDIRKAEKKMNGLIDDNNQLLKKKEKLDKDIEQNKLDQKKLQEQLDAKKQAYQEYLKKKNE